MIIGIDASRANKENKTGTEWYAFNVIQELKKIISNEDEVILYSKNELMGSLAELPANFRYKILKWWPGFLWTQLRLSWEIIFHKPDVLFIPAHTIPLFSPKETVTTLHDVGFEEFQNLYSDKKIGPQNIFLRFIYGIAFRILTLGKYRNNELDYHRWSARLAIKKAKKIITISDFSINEINRHFQVDQDKLVNVYNSYNPIYRVVNDENVLNSTLKKYKIFNDYFLYIGRLEEKKNTPLMIEAFGKFKEKNNNPVKLVLAGPKGYGYERVKENILKYNLQNEVIELGWVDNEDLPHLMNKASVFCFPSLYEGFGMPILEAMASGTPVLTSNFGAMKEVAADAALLVDTKDPDQISAGLEKLYFNRSYATDLVKKGLERIKLFSWEKTARKINEVIHGI